MMRCSGMRGGSVHAGKRRGAQVALPRGSAAARYSARIAAFTLFSMMLLFAMITLFAAAIFRHA
jgi:hypothetical protein